MTYIIHSAAAKWDKASAAGSVTAAPAHCYRGTDLGSGYFIICYCESIFAAVWIRTGELYWISLANQPGHTLKFSHFFLSNVVGVFHHILSTLIFWLYNSTLRTRRLHSLSRSWCHTTSSRHVWRLGYAGTLGHLNNRNTFIHGWHLRRITNRWQFVTTQGKSIVICW